jgi:hypothetical protein
MLPASSKAQNAQRNHTRRINASRGSSRNMITQLSEACRSRLFRLTLRAPVEGVAFVMADSREAAWRIGRTVLAVLQSVPVFEVEFGDMHAFGELVRMGVSDDEDLRVFELAQEDMQVTQWTVAPYFLTDDASLLGKWAELRADLATVVAASAIRRAK